MTTSPQEALRKALEAHHKDRLCEGPRHNQQHSLTQLMRQGYEQTELYRQTIAALAAAEPEQQPVAPMLKTWPERIWLQHGDSPEVPNYANCTDVSWCWHSIEDADVEYVRADLASHLRGKKESSGQVPIEAIGKLLNEAMDAAVRNGANSVSMPDEYVEIALWLSALPDGGGE